MTKRLGFLTVAVALSSVVAFAQERAIEFPDVPGYRTLAVDLHTHSVFSDGLVWPFIRVDESDRDGLDLLAVTEHLEYQPRSEDIPHPDRNRSFIVASEYVKTADSDLIVINGAEVTRDMPPGHVNAVFITDANALLADDPMDSFRAANQQGAFVFWNHPSWTSQAPDGVALLPDMHQRLIADGQLHGIEVANEYIYSAESLQIALDYDLAILGVSDIHGLIDWDYAIHDGAHRTVTLVFAEERSAELVHRALRANRTVAWTDNSLIGREEVLMPLIQASLTVSSVGYRADSTLVDVTLSNVSDAAFELRSIDGHRFYNHPSVFRVPPHGQVVLGLTGEDRSSFDLQFEVLNAIIAPETHPLLRLGIEVPPETDQ